MTLASETLRAVLIAVAWVVVARLSEVTVTSNGIPVVILTAGFVAACLHRWRVGAAPGLILGIALWLGWSAWAQPSLTAGSSLLLTAVMAVAAVIAGVLLAWIVTALGIRMERASEPSLLLLACLLTGLVMGIAAVVPGAGALSATAWAAVWSASVLGSLLVLTVALTYRSWRAIRRPVEFVVFTAIFLTTVLVVSENSFASVGVGFVAWLLLPVLLLVGARYGVFAASLMTGLSGAGTLWAITRLPLGSGSWVLERQIVSVLLVCATFTLLLLVRQQRAALAQLEAAQEITQAFLANADPMWYVKHLVGDQLVYESLGGGSFRGWSDGNGVTDESLFGAQAAEDLMAADQAVIDTGLGSVGIEVLRTPDSGTRTFLANRFPIKDSSGRTFAVGGMRTDVTDREHQAAVQQRQSRLLEAMFESSPVPTMRVSRSDDGMTVAAVNQALCLVVGRRAAELVGQSVNALVDDRDWPQVESLFEREVRREPGLRWNPQAEIRLHTLVGGQRLALVTVAPLRLNRERPVEYIVHLEDVTARRAAEEAVARHSMFDNATGLLNRMALGDRLDAALHRISAQVSGGVTLVALDIDDFKSVNDSFGHAAGDQILTEFGRRLTQVCGPGDAVARLGADEFAVVTDRPTNEAAGLLVGRLQEALATAVEYDGVSIACTSTFGVAVTQEANLRAGELVRRAELALFRAKRAGRGKVEFYAEAMREQAQTALNVRNELARAVANDGLAAHYQPIVRMSDGEVVAYEALMRLPTADGRLLGPGAFLDVARSIDMLPVMDQMIMRRALTDLAGNRLPVPTAGVSVNTEAEELRDPQFAMRVLELLHATGVDPERMTVEVTESALLQLDDAVLGNVRTLRDAGIVFAIDDFGTGYSSLAQLRNLSVDILKIDRSFVIEMENDEEAANIVATVIGLAHSLGLDALAEGIETRGQAEALGRLSCDYGQGYMFGRPQPIEAPPSQGATDPSAVRSQKA